MELWAVIAALQIIKNPKQEISIYSDSKYVVDAVEKKWLNRWVATGFKGKKNSDLWLKFWDLYHQHKVKLIWVKGHAGCPQNERCDQLALASSHSSVFSATGPR